MIGFILSLIGLLVICFLCLVLGAVAFCVGMGEIYKKEGKYEEYKEIIKFVNSHKRKQGGTIL